MLHSMHSMRSLHEAFERVQPGTMAEATVFLVVQRATGRTLLQSKGRWERTVLPPVLRSLGSGGEMTMTMTMSNRRDRRIGEVPVHVRRCKGVGVAKIAKTGVSIPHPHR